MAVELLDSTSEIGILYTQYLSHLPSQETDPRKDAEENTSLESISIGDSSVPTNEVKGTTNHSTTYNNGDKTLEDISAIRSNNQKNSALLKLPTELLIAIWKMAFGSTKTRRVHGMVSRGIPDNRILSLAHTCSLLHNALYPVFLGQDAFVVKIPSTDFTVAASELTRWLSRIPSASVLGGAIRPLILMELQARRLPIREARKLAAELQFIYSPPKPFQPTIVVETADAAGGCYCGPYMYVLAWPPTGEGPSRLGHPMDQQDVWKGWVVSKRIMSTEEIQNGVPNIGLLEEFRRGFRAHTQPSG